MQRTGGRNVDKPLAHLHFAFCNRPENRHGRANEQLMAETVPTNIDIAAATATAPKLRRTVEDQAIEKYIRDAGSFLEEARLSPDIAEALASAGYDGEELTWGMNLQERAWNAFCAARGESPADRQGGEAALDAKVAAARDEWLAFRLIARAAFTSLDARLDLRVMGDVPEDLQRFLNVAHAGYAAASEDPYTDKLFKRGYVPARLKTLSSALDQLATLDGELDAAEEVADNGPLDPEERNATYVALKEYMKELKGVSRAIFRRQPETLTKLSL